MASSAVEGTATFCTDVRT